MSFRFSNILFVASITFKNRFPHALFRLPLFFLLITRFLAVFQLFRVIIAVFLNMAFIAYYPISITEDRNSNDCYISRFLCGFVQCTAQVSPIIPYNIHTYAVYVYNVKPNRFIYRSSKRNWVRMDTYQSERKLRGKRKRQVDYNWLVSHLKR